MSDPTDQVAISNPVAAKLQFAVPGAPIAPPALNLPAPVDHPIAAGLETVSTTTEARQSIDCKDMIPQAEQVKARAEAMKLLPQMLGNSQVVMTYGGSSLQGVNQLIDRLMKEVRPANIAALKDIMTGLTLNMKSIQGKYDLTTTSGKKNYDEWQNSRLRKLIHRGHNYFEAMLADMQTVDRQLDNVQKDLIKRRDEIARSVIYLDTLYAENEGSVYLLIYATAVMEFISELAAQRAKSLPPTDPNTGRENEEVKKLTDLVLQMNIKIGEYKGRVFVAWATSPQIRMMRMLNVGMAEKLNEASGMTIYTIKLAIVQWRTLAATQEGARASESVSLATNEALKGLAAAGAQAGSAVMNAIQSPTILPETVTAVTDSLVEMANNILTAVQEGDQRRELLGTTMVQQKAVLDGNQRNFNEQVISGIVSDATAPALPSGS